MIKETAKFLEVDRNDHKISEIVEDTSFRAIHQKVKKETGIAFTRKGK